MTTFSTFVVEVDLLVKAGRLPTATWYVAATMLGGLTVTRAAIVLARAVWKQEN
jgi:fluoride ion exporter CrcB/FEX